jgi:TolB-like protein/class 3 adenylate cyclase/Flp pilus assembly protein TadD
MSEERAQRRLAAIMAADVVGYSKMMGRDEAGTLARLKSLRAEFLHPKVTEYGGRIVKTTGDGTLIEFPSAVDAVAHAVDVQREMAERNAKLPRDQQIQLRLGINVGDIIVDENDIYGDGVNVAARLEALAEPGGICVSSIVNESVGSRVDIALQDGGEVTVKNIERPIRVWKWNPGRGAVTAQPISGTIATATGPPLPDKPSIAVLPFHNMSGDSEQEYFGDGITEDIITALSKLKGFFVIARNSTFAYKDKAPDVRQVARELGVRYVLEGSVRRAGKRLRVTGQLIDATSGNHIWAERYDRPAADVFALQDEITNSVVSAIEPQLYAAENLRLKSKPPESLDAWGCVVRAMPFIWMWVSQDDDTGINLLKRAIELDPGYARARSLLAWIFASRVSLGNMDYERGISDALALAQRAIDLDPDDPWGHMAAGYVNVFSRRFGPAVEELNEALQRNPGFSYARSILAAAYGYAGLAEEGYRQLEIATRMSPRDYSQSANLSIEGLCHLVAGRYSEAVTAERRAVQIRPDFGTAWRTLTAAAGLAGNLELARQALAECKRLQPGLSIAWVEKYYPMIRAEDRARYIEGLCRAGLE